MMRKIKSLAAVMLSLAIIAVSTPVNILFASADNSGTDNFKVVREDPSALAWDSSDVAYIDFSEIEAISVKNNTVGNGLTLLANYGASSWKASNRLSDDKYLLLGKDANSDGKTPEKLDVGNAYFKLQLDKSNKSSTAFAVKIDFYGGGEKVDAGSYINLTYNSSKGTASGRNTYGANYGSGNIETMYFSLPEADFSENIGSCGADFRLETWTQAQLKIRRVSVIAYDAIDVPEMKTLKKATEGSEPIASINFSALESVPVNGIASGEGLTIVTSVSTGNIRASNIVEDGYLLLGNAARNNDNPADMSAKPTVTGSIYIKLNAELAEKAGNSYAVKVDYYGGGIKTDSGSYIDLCYNSDTNANKKLRKTYGATYNSGKTESMYYLLSDSNFCEKINNEACGADFRLETWSSAQLKICKISVVKYDSKNTPSDASTLFSNEDADDIPEDTAFINPNIGECYGLNYASGTPIVKIIDKDGEEHYAAQSVDYLNFKVSDPDVKAAKKITLSISYWDIGTRSFSIEYNAEIPDSLPPNTAENYYNYYSTSSFEMYDTKELVTIDIPIENAAFDNKQTGSNDFRIRTMYISDFYIEQISLKIGVEDVTLRDPVDFPEMTESNNFKDRTVVGYQAWFQASESKTSGWNHWNSGAAPAGSQQTFDIYPDVSDFPDSVLYQTNYANLLNGQQAVLYDGTTEEAINVQVKWMQDYGIDGFAVSRFYSGTSAVEITVRNKLDYMKEAAEKYDRIFYMGYDMSGIGGNGEAGIKRLESDFVLNVEKKYVSSPNYAQIDGKPVVSLWGFQGSEFNRYPATENALSLINWFHDRGYYVIGGCPDNNWALDKTDYAEVYRQIDMITPWTVGRYSSSNVVDYCDAKYKQDKQYINKYNAENPDTPKSYMPTIYPGFSWANWATGPNNGIARNAGDFMWQQARLAAKYGFTSSFIAMFDEYDEGTSIAKMAEDSMSIPADQYFVTAAADGKWLSSDFYLRATAAVAKLLRGEITDSTSIPIPQATGPVYWRNSFERRFINYKTTSGQLVTTLANLDVCLPDGEILDFVGIEDMKRFDIAEDPYAEGYSLTGEYSLNIDGISSPSDGQSKFYFKIGNTDISVHSGMVLQYNLRAETELGGHVFIDLIFDDGKKLSEISGTDAVKAERGTVGDWAQVMLTIPDSLSGRKIVSVVAAYDYAYPGEFNAYIDDVIIKDGEFGTDELKSLINDAESLIRGNREQYFTVSSVSNLKNVISEAKTALDKGNVAIKKAFNLLVDAINKLISVPRKIPVVGPITEIKPENTVVTDDYTSDQQEQIKEESINTVKQDDKTNNPVVKKVIKKVKKTGNKIPWVLILIAFGIIAVALLAMMVYVNIKRRKENKQLKI